MPANTSTQDHKAGRSALLSLHATMALRRQHPGKPELWRTADRRTQAALAEATRNRPLLLELRSGAVHVDDQPVLPFRVDERPFGQLRRAGIGEIELAHALGADEIAQLVQQLIELADNDDLDAGLNALLDAASLPGVALRARADLDEGLRPDDVDWTLLPPRGASDPTVHALVDRDSSCNLPALTVRQLLEDADEDSTQLQEILQRLLARLLKADDVKSASWLLTELDSHPHFEGAARSRLQAMAREHCSPDWLRWKLEHGTNEELLAVSALVMMLGGEVAECFAYCAADMAHPLSQWLGDLIGRPGGR